MEAIDVDAEVQTARDDLNESTAVEVESKRFETLPVDQIHHFEAVPDYKASEDVKYPIVVDENGQLQCIDNWSMVEAARTGTLQQIVCLVITPADPSPTDTALRKLASRVKTEGGEASYAEIIRGVKFVRGMLENENSELVTFSHGGKRRGADFNNDKENDLSLVLAYRLGKIAGYVRKYLSHANYLTNDLLDHLVTKEAVKKFFSKLMRRKIKRQKNFKSRMMREEIEKGNFYFCHGKHKLFEKKRRSNPSASGTSGSQTPLFLQMRLHEGEATSPPETQGGSESGVSRKGAGFVLLPV